MDLYGGFIGIWMDLYGRNITEIKDHARIFGKSSLSQILRRASEDLRDQRKFMKRTYNISSWQEFFSLYTDVDGNSFCFCRQ